MRRFVECSVCGDRIEEGERAFRIDGEWYCDICGMEWFRDEYEMCVDGQDCDDDGCRRSLISMLMADDAEYDAYKARMSGIDY